MNVNRFAWTALGSLFLGGCGSYYTTSLQGGDKDGYQFIAPYVTSADTDISVSIIPGKTSSDPATATLSVLPIPKTRGYRYLKKSMLFSDMANVTVGADGFLSGSGSVSNQQITAILSTLGQTAGPMLYGFLAPNISGGGDVHTCQSIIKEVAPSYWRKPATLGSTVLYPDSATADQSAVISLVVEPSAIATEKKEEITTAVDGIVAFYPNPVIVSVSCKDGTGTTLMTPPTAVNLYSYAAVIKPMRDFFSGPQDTLTFDHGFLTGHKFTDQSPVKTVIDTVTAPVRAIMPSVSVSVQTGGGKPDQTTTTTAPSKGP